MRTCVHYFVVILGALLALWGCSRQESTAPTLLPSPTPPSPLTTPSLPSPRPTASSTPQPSPTPAVTMSPPSPTVASASPTWTPSLTPSPTAAPLAFAGHCEYEIKEPCLYSIGWTVYQGQRVYRYVFENLPHPETFFVEINGVRLDCITLPDISPSRAYCMGVVPPTRPIQLRLGYIQDNMLYEIPVPPIVLAAIQNDIPVGEPPKPRLLGGEGSYP